MKATGSFSVTMQGEPPYDSVDNVMLSRASFAKQFTGPLTATSTVQMLACRGPVANSAGYVALERIVGTLDGHEGSFVVMHMGVMNKGEQSLRIVIVPDAGTGALQGITGTLSIDIVDKQHFYTVDYTLNP